MSKRGAAFSGGGFYGNVTVGMLQRIAEDDGFKPWDCMTGISTGGLIASIIVMYPKNEFRTAVQRVVDIYTPRTTKDIHEAWLFGKLAALWKPSLRKTSDGLTKLIDGLSDPSKMRGGPYQTGVGVLNLERGEYELIDHNFVPYNRAIEGSASLPAFFEPVRIPTKGLCVDGGAVLGCDISQLIKWGCTEIDAFVTVPERIDPKSMEDPKTIDVALRTFECMVHAALWRDIRMTEIYNLLAKADPDCGKKYIELRVWAPDRVIGDPMEFVPSQAVELQKIGRDAADRILAG